MTTTHRNLTILLFTLIGVATYHVASLGQEAEGEGRRATRGPRSGRVPTFVDPQSGQRAEIPPFATQNHFAAQPQPDAGTSEPRDMIALTVWDLTISDSTGPESDELVGKLIDKTSNLPTVVGTADEVRDLVNRLKAASLVRKSREVRVLTTDGQPTYAQSGTSRPSVVASNFTTINPPMTGRGSRRANLEAPAPNPTPAPTPNEPPAPEPIVTNSIQYRDIGTIVELIPRIDTSGAVLVQFSYNSSDIESSPDVALTDMPGRKPIMADRTVICQVRSSVRLKSGTAVIVQTDASRTSNGESSTGDTRLLILAASVQPALE
jgi:hypothetical protein